MSDKETSLVQRIMDSDKPRANYSTASDLVYEEISTDHGRGIAYVVKLELRDVCDPYGIEYGQEHILHIAFALHRAGASADDVPRVLAEFITTDDFAHCLKYRHPPAPSDVADVYERLSGESAVTESEKRYREYLEERERKWIKDTDADE